MYPLEGEKERKRVERERIGVSVFKLATVALAINTNPFNHNPPMTKHSKCLINRAASSSIQYKIPMEVKSNFSSPQGML
jgi:hypothetical protein